MLPLKSRLIAVQKLKNAHWETVELDYTLSLILVAIARYALAAKSLIFKGGTALKKCYFGSKYRFSQDLDFTLVGDLSKNYLIRSRVRDFYDLWHILEQFRNEIDLTNFQALFLQKCRYKGIEFKSPEQFFEPNYLNRIKSDWEQFLTMLIENLPEFDELVNKLKVLTAEVFPGRKNG